MAERTLFDNNPGFLNAFKQFVIDIKNGSSPEESLTIIKHFYLNNKTDNESSADFFARIKKECKSYISNKFTQTNHKETLEPLDYFKHKETEIFKENALNLFRNMLSNVTNLPYKNIHSNMLLNNVLTYSQILNCSQERLYHFMQELKKWKQSKQDQTQSFYPNKEVNQKIQDTYANSELHELIPLFIQECNIKNNRNHLFDQIFTPHCNILDEDIIVGCQIISNMLESFNLIDNQHINANHLFDGNNFFDFETYEPVCWNNIAKGQLFQSFIKNPPNMLKQQSQLAYNDQQINYLISSQKSPIAYQEYDLQDKKITFELYSIPPAEYKNKDIETTYPIILKYKTSSKTNDHFSFGLYVINDDNINTATQLLRMERDDGDLHKQKGGEIIEKGIHIHLGNMLNQILLSNKNKGHFDIFKNYIFDSQLNLSNEQYEAIFDSMCQIDGSPTITIDQVVKNAQNMISEQQS